jgi:hypothetical protein
VSPSPLFSKQEWASFFREFGENTCRHQKVLVSNLGLTAFVKHLVKLVKQGPQSALREQKRKIVKRDRDLTVSVFLFSFFFFFPYHSKSLQMLPLFSYKIHASQDI